MSENRGTDLEAIPLHAPVIIETSPSAADGAATVRVLEGNPDFLATHSPYNAPVPFPAPHRLRPVSVREPRALRSSPLAGPSVSSNSVVDDDENHADAAGSSSDKPKYKPNRISSTPDLRSNRASIHVAVSPDRRASPPHSPEGDKKSTIRPSTSDGAAKPSKEEKARRRQTLGTYTTLSLPEKRKARPLSQVPPNPPVPEWARTGVPSANSQRGPPSISRDPSQNWMSSNFYTTTPRFSRLSMAAGNVVLPVSAREYDRMRRSSKMSMRPPNTNPDSLPMPRIPPPTNTSTDSLPAPRMPAASDDPYKMSGGSQSTPTLPTQQHHDTDDTPASPSSRTATTTTPNSDRTLVEQDPPEQKLKRERTLRHRLSQVLKYKPKLTIPTVPIPQLTKGREVASRDSSPSLHAADAPVKVTLQVETSDEEGKVDLGGLKRMPTARKAGLKIKKTWHRLMGAKADAL